MATNLRHPIVSLLATEPASDGKEPGSAGESSTARSSPWRGHAHARFGPRVAAGPGLDRCSFRPGCETPKPHLDSGRAVALERAGQRLWLGMLNRDRFDLEPAWREHDKLASE